ncbi:MAG: helix-turn-helix transcriptional regulator [Desulfobacteraceae bacterium]|jgi:DNA-binding XRE family transcriptional regulator
MARPTYKDFKEKALRDPEIKAEYDALEPVYELRKKLIEMRTRKGLTQTELAKIMHTQKSNISRLECGENISFPTLDTINKYARALGYKVNIEFNPL